MRSTRLVAFCPRVFRFGALAPSSQKKAADAKTKQAREQPSRACMEKSACYSVHLRGGPHPASPPGVPHCAQADDAEQGEAGGFGDGGKGDGVKQVSGCNVC